MSWQKIKKKIGEFLNKLALSCTLKANPDRSTEITFSLSPSSSSADSKEVEKIIQRFASKNIKTIGDLSPGETFHGLVAAALYFFEIGKYTLSTRYGEEALRNEPKDYNLRVWLIKVNGNYIGPADLSAKQKAVEMCSEAIRIEPNNYKAHFLNAVYSSHIKSPNDSIPLYLIAKKLMEDQNLTTLSDYGQLCSFLGSLYLMESNYKNENEAETLFRRSVLILQHYIDDNNKFWLDHTKKCLNELLLNS